MRLSNLTLLSVAVWLALLTSCAPLGGMSRKEPACLLISVGRVGKAAARASQDINEEQEIYLGRSVSARLLTRYRLLEDPGLHKYVNMVGATVAMASDRPDLPFHFAVLDTDEVNAFAAPGGYIFITKGLLKSLRDEDELAAILAHEIGHVSAKHSLAMIKSGQWKQVALLTAKETARHQGVNPKLLNLFGRITDKVLDTLLTAGYGQPQEFEADALGQTYAARAGYDPGALRRFATVMKKREKRGDKSLKARLGTHPTFTARLAKLPPAPGPAPDPELVDFRLSRFKAALE